MRHATAGWVGVLTAAAFGCVSDTIAQSECENNLLLATTNQSELVELYIRLPFSHVELIGPTNPDGPGWTGLSFDFEGSLFVTSRHTSHTAIDGCFGFYGGLDTDGGCSHLFRVDPTTGIALEEIGSTGIAFLSDIDFAPDGTLYASYFMDEIASGDGALAVLDLTTATATLVGRFEEFPDGLENGALSVHPLTGEMWAAENNFVLPPSIFRVDSETGRAIPPIVQLGLEGSLTGFGLGALEILPDGRIIAIRGKSSDVFEVNPVADEQSGLAELTPIPLPLSGAAGSLNGLEFLPPLSLVAEEPVETVIRWNSTPLAIAYDVIRGNTDELSDDGTIVRLGAVTCIEDDSLDETTGPGTELGNPDNEMPSLGQAFFYLVRSFDGRRKSTYGFRDGCSSERQVDFGDCS